MAVLGFTDKQRSELEAIHEEVFQNFTYVTDQEKFGIADYWEDDKVLLPAVTKNAPLKSDCEEFAMVCMRKAIAKGYNARLVVCLDETHNGHCIAEVESADGAQAYYFDNRRRSLATQQSLIGYTFYSMSPINPQPGDTRPWSLVQA